MPRADRLPFRAGRPRLGATVLGATLLACLAPVASAQRLPPTAPASERPALNFFGLPGLMDTPTARALPDGEIGLSTAAFGGMARLSLSSQITPRISGTFRYNRFEDLFYGGYEDYYDRGFDVRFQLLFEDRWWPGLSVGLQDFAGTGLQSGEYVVATRTLTPGLSVSAGLGWGRLGSYGEIGELREDPGGFEAGDLGGTFQPQTWFAGPYAPFGGIEWRPTERLGLKLEYSSDAYTLESEDRGLFDRRSPINFGVEYQAAPYLRLGAYSMYGDTIGVSASLSLNARRPVSELILPAAPPVAVRGPAPGAAASWSSAWTASADTRTALRTALQQGLAAEGQTLAGLELDATEAHVWVGNPRHQQPALASGRIARVLARTLPPSVETFRITHVAGNLSLSTLTLARSDLEALETQTDRATALRARAEVSSGVPLPDTARLGAPFPRFSWQLTPSFRTSYFDPEQPLRYEVAAQLSGEVALTPGLSFGATVSRALLGDLDKARVAPIEGVPSVRSDWPLYYPRDEFRLETLMFAWRGRLARDLYASARLGYVERAFAGLTTEALWKPQQNRLGIGATLNHVAERDPFSHTGLNDYSVTTGHLSLYYETEGGYYGQLDAGRYLAGDVGATLTVKRVFANGVEIGAFATLTDMPAEDFGEGSFDKGIMFRIPLTFVSGQPSRRAISRTIRPVQRDGGARLVGVGHLYDDLRDADGQRYDKGWPLIWR